MIISGRLSVYILLALSWACIYAFVEIVSPGHFRSLPPPMRWRDRKERICSAT